MGTQGGGGGGKDVRAGGAFFELFAKDNLTGTLDRMKRKALAFGGFMQKLGTTAAVAGAGIAAPLTALFKGGFDRAAETAKMSQQLGIPIELMSKLQYAAEEAGVSVDEVMKDTEGRFTKLVNNAPSVDPERARQALEVQRQMKSAVDALQQAMLPLLDTIVPIVKQIAAWAKENASSVRTAAAVAVGLLVLAGVIKGVVVAYGLLKGAALAAWAVIGGPFLLGAALGAAFVATILWATGELKGFTNWLGSGFGGAADTAKKAWGGITDAIGKGDLALAGKIAVKGLEVVWLDFMLTMQTAWVGFKSVFVDGWATIVAGVKIVWAGFVGWLNKTFTAVIDGILSAAYTAAKTIGATGLMNDVDELRKKIIPGPDKIDKATNDEKERIAKDLADELAARKEARMDDLRDAILAKKQAEAELGDLVTQAAVPPEKIKADKLPPPVSQVAQAVKGGFSGSALGLQFGASNEAQKQTEFLKQIAANLKEQPDKIGAAVGDELKIK